MDIYQENLVSQYQVSSECLIVEYHVSLSFKIDNNREKTYRISIKKYIVK